MSPRTETIRNDRAAVGGPRLEPLRPGYQERAMSYLALPRPQAGQQLRAWSMVGACAVMVAMGFGAIVNMAVFLTPLATEFGWSRGDLSLAYSLVTIGTGTGGILMGHFADRISIRRVALCGAIVPAAMLLGLSQLHSTGELYFYHAVMGLLGLGAIMAPMNTVAGLWMPRNPGLAIGIVSAGGAFGQGVIPFIARHLILVDGWRHAYMGMALLHLAIMLPLALLLRNAEAATTARVAVPQAKSYAAPRHVLIGLLCVAVVFCCVCMGTPIVHVAALGADRGLLQREAAGLLTVMMLCGMAGRIGFGKLADRFGNLKAYIGASAGQTALAFLFPLMTGKTGLYLLSGLFGLVFSGAMTAFILCAREYADPRRSGLVIGTVMFFAWVGMAAGGWQGGVFYDLCGSYGVSFANASLGGVANLLVLAVLYRFTAGAHASSRVNRVAERVGR
jgi:MFS family permease